MLPSILLTHLKFPIDSAFSSDLSSAKQYTGEKSEEEKSMGNRHKRKIREVVVVFASVCSEVGVPLKSWGEDGRQHVFFLFSEFHLFMQILFLPLRLTFVGSRAGVGEGEAGLCHSPP